MSEETRKAFTTLTAVFDLPVAIAGFIGLINSNYLVLKISAIVFIIVLIVVFVICFKLKRSPILYFFAQAFGSSAYKLKTLQSRFVFSSPDVANYYVTCDVVSRCNYTFGVIERFLERTYASLNDVSSKIKLLTPNSTLSQIWKDSGWVCFTILPERPIEKSTPSKSIEYVMENVEKPQPVLGSYVHRDRPVKELSFSVEFTSEQLNCISRIQKVVRVGVAPPFKVIYHQDVIKQRDVSWSIKYPIEGYRYSIEWDIDSKYTSC